jgi:hypothetical protein
MTKEITKSEFEALKLIAHDIHKENDVEYGYETLFDRSGLEIGYATYHSYHGATYRQHEVPQLNSLGRWNSVISDFEPAKADV